MHKRLGHRGWTKLKNYGKRWSAETAYSAFRRTFGDSCMSKIFQNIIKKLTPRACIYNTLINL